MMNIAPMDTVCGRMPEEDAFYYDMYRDEQLSKVKTIGAYWALLADIVPLERLPRFIEHLENPNEFKRPHRVPTLSADHPQYREDGGYWLGGVWAPTNYMLLRGLHKVGWTGLIPVAVLIEFVLGINADPQKDEIVWHITRTERHGIERYPFGEKLVDLVCEARESVTAEPQIKIRCEKPVRVRVIWNDMEKIVE